MPEQKIKILIVEDDPIIGLDLSGYMQDFGYMPQEPATCAEDALKSLKHELPGLVLLDVGLDGEIDGIQLAGIIQEKYDLPIIFLTAFHDDKTIDRIKATRPNGYLVKPIDERSLKTSIEVALYNFQHRQPAETEAMVNKEEFINEDHFFIKVKQGLHKVLLKEILFFEAYDNYSYVHTTDKKYLVSMPLKNIENKLPSRIFARVHRSFIINVEKMRGIEDDNIMIEGKSVPIGKTYRTDVMKFINLL